MQSAAIEFKYALGTCLHEGEREAEYETRHDGNPAVVKFIRPETSLEAAKMVAGFASAAKHPEPGAAPVLDFGETEVFETHVVFVVTDARPADAREAAEPAAALPLYRKHAKLAIGGVIGAGALCLMLLRSAEHKAPPPVPAPVAVRQAEPQQATVSPEPVAQPVAKARGHKRARRRHK